MKNIYFSIIVYIFISINIYSQDIYDPNPFIFNGISNTFTFDINQTKYQQGNNFIITWQWGANFRLCDALHFNSIQQSYTPQYFYDINNQVKNNNLLNILSIGDGSTGADLLSPPAMSMGFIYEPTLKIRNFIRFNHKENDPNNSVFGFKTIQTPLTSDNVVDDRLVLHPNINYTNPVLSNPCPDNELDILLKIKIIFKNNIDIFYI